MMNILRRFKRSSSDAGSAEDRTKTSNETVPETVRAVTELGLNLGMERRGRIARTLFSISDRLGITTEGGFDESDFVRGRALDYPDIPSKYKFKQRSEPLELSRRSRVAKSFDKTRNRSSKYGLDDLGFKRGAALDYPQIPGEEHRTTDLVKELDRNRADREYQSENEDTEYAHPPWSSIDFPKVPGEEYKNASLNVINRYTRKVLPRVRREAQVLPGSNAGSLGQQDSDSVMQKDSIPFIPRHQAERVLAIDFAGTENSSLYQQFDAIPSNTTKGAAGERSNEFAGLSSPHLGIGGISSERLAEPTSLSEYLTKLVDQGRKGFIFEEPLPFQTLARSGETPENGTSSSPRNLSPLRWEHRFKQGNQQDKELLKDLKLMENNIQEEYTEEQERITKQQSDAFDIRYTISSGERKREEDEISDTSNVSAASSIPSVADTLFTMVSGSSMSSVSGPQGAGERLVGLLLEDVIIKEACYEALLTIEEERFERNLRRLLRDFSLELRKEAETVQQRHAANFVRFRARNSAHIICNSLKPGRKPRVGNEPEEESENEDSDRSEDEGENLEIFIKSSKAFDAFRTKLRAFVYPSEPQANDTRLKAGNRSKGHDDDDDIRTKVPTQDKSQGVDIENLDDEDPPNVASVVKAFNAILDTIWKPLRNTPHPVPRGKTRVEWQCKCGQTIYDDVVELKPGAAEKLRETLKQMNKSTASSRSSRVSSFASTFSTSLNSFSSLFSVSNKGLKHSLPFHQRHLPSHTTSGDAPMPQDPNAPLQEPQFLPICYRDGRYATRLMQPDLIDQHVDSDRALFDLLRSSYQATRGSWTSMFSLQTLSWIKFVQFELYHGELVDVRKVNDMPPPEHVEYRYAPAPPDVMPPIGDMQMMHLFQNPSCAANSPWLMERFPKKLLRPLTCANEASASPLTPGWGIQFLVSWDIPKIWLISFLFFGFGSALIGILWCVFKHSIQDAFAIAAYVVAFGTVSVGSVQALLVM